MTKSSLEKLPAQDSNSGLYNVVVESPKGSRNKNKYDPEADVWRLSKVLPLGASFPFDFGFIPSTKGADGDPIDVLVLTDEPAFAGCVLPVRLIGMLEAEQTEQGETLRNDRLIGVIETPHNPPWAHNLDDLADSQLCEIEHFFVSYNQVEGRVFKVLARRGSAEAEELVKSCTAE